MFRLVVPRSPRAAAGTVLFTYVWLVLVWFVFRDDPPQALAAMVIISVTLAFASLYIQLHGPVAWEVDGSRVRKTTRDRTVIEIPLSEVVELRVTVLRAPVGRVILGVVGRGPPQYLVFDN